MKGKPGGLGGVYFSRSPLFVSESGPGVERLGFGRNFPPPPPLPLLTLTRHFTRLGRVLFITVLLWLRVMGGVAPADEPLFGEGRGGGGGGEREARQTPSFPFLFLLNR